MSIAKTGVCCGCGIVMQGVYSGNISIYFPCQTKDKEALQWFHRKWNSCRRRQLRDIRMRKAPLTDLMDLDIYRSEKEKILTDLQSKITMFGGIYQNHASTPYALSCLQQAYRKIREDNLFTKNTNVLVSRKKSLTNC